MSSIGMTEAKAQSTAISEDSVISESEKMQEQLLKATLDLDVDKVRSFIDKGLVRICISW